VSESVRGEGIGSMLLDFIKAYFIIDNKTGCRFVTVDAYRSAIPFYEKNGFLPLQADDDTSAPTRLMFFDLADYRKQLKDIE
jgi:GNAT superfamily N-acetyltransferase